MLALLCPLLLSVSLYMHVSGQTKKKLHDADTDDIDVRLVDFGSAFVVGETGESGPKNDSGTIAYR